MFNQVQLRQKYYTPQVQPDSLGFRLMTSRSWQYISCHWDACSNHLAISDCCNTKIYIFILSFVKVNISKNGTSLFSITCTSFCCHTSFLSVVTYGTAFHSTSGCWLLACLHYLIPYTLYASVPYKTLVNITLSCIYACASYTCSRDYSIS